MPDTTGPTTTLVATLQFPRVVLERRDCTSLLGELVKMCGALDPAAGLDGRTRAELVLERRDDGDWVSFSLEMIDA